jgi:two-component system, OmpR family, sensor histidine kinase BaeS
LNSLSGIFVHKSIRFKLFLTFLLTTSLVVSGMYVFMRWSLDRGFSDFIEKRQQERISALIEGLSEYYADDPGWRELTGNKRKWMELLGQAYEHRYYRPAPWFKQALNEPPDVWPPALPESHKSWRFKPLELSVMLLRADKSIIFGRREALSQLTLHAIRYQGQTVGFLGVLPGKPVNQPLELQFMERQSQAFVWIAIFMVLLSAGLALLLAYTLVRPLKRITAAAKALAVGSYDMRLPVESGDELGQLARDFNEMAAALEQSEQTRRRWVADISHELRTPLAVLRGELEALQDGIRPLTRDAVDSLMNDVMRLHRLTDDLYQLSLSDQGALSYRKTEVDPVEVLKQDLAALAPEFDSKQLRVHLINKLTAAISIHADPDRLSQLYRNLLNNSINYTDRGGRLDITVSQQANMLIMVFADSAPGVPSQELPRLLDRFYRVESSRSRHHGGAGLGLAICSNIVQAHNGALQAQASWLGGLAIHIELPIKS